MYERDARSRFKPNECRVRVTNQKKKFNEHGAAFTKIGVCMIDMWQIVKRSISISGIEGAGWVLQDEAPSKVSLKGNTPDIGDGDLLIL